MHELLQASSYELRLHSAPFLVAFAALAVVAAYALLVRGVALARWSMLGFAIGLAVYVASLAVAASLAEPAAATAAFRMGLAGIPLTAACAMIFQLAVVERYHAHRWVARLALGSGVVFAALSVVTDWVVVGVRSLPVGMYYLVPGPAFAVAAAAVMAWSGMGFAALLRTRRSSGSRTRRATIARTMGAMAAAWLGCVDIVIAYAGTPAPIGTAFLTLAALLALRAFVVDDLLHARAIDDVVVGVVAYAVVATAALWALVRWAVPLLPWPVVPPLLLAGLVVARVVTAAAWALRPARPGRDATRDRLLAQFTARVHRLRTAREIGALTGEVLELATGRAAALALAEDGGQRWTDLDGAVVAAPAAPTPALAAWMIAHGRPVPRDELESLALHGLRGPLEALLDATGAVAVVPLVERATMLGLLTLRGDDGDRPLRRDELVLLARLGAQLAAALAFVRLAHDARARVALEREVELAAAVQAGLVPPAELVAAGDVTVYGTWTPATRCGGDWWVVRELSGGRTLLAIGDVTGHGVAAAMVTAAVKGAFDATLELVAGDVDPAVLMTRLDAAVRRAGGGRFLLTCFVAVLHPAAGVVTFANAGHTVPYLLRPRAGQEPELHALVARGNPLGGATPHVARVAQRPLLPGDVLVWYTDGVVECLDPAGAQFGDRRMQRLLRRLDPAGRTLPALHAAIAEATAAHRAGRPHDDDLTLLVAAVGGAA